MSRCNRWPIWIFLPALIAFFAAVCAMGQEAKTIRGTLAGAGRGQLIVATQSGNVTVPVNAKTKIDITGTGPKELLQVGAIVRVVGQLSFAAPDVVKGASVEVCVTWQSGKLHTMIAQNGDTAIGAALVARVEKLDPLTVRALPQTQGVVFLSPDGRMIGKKELAGSTYRVEARDAKELPVFFGSDLTYAGKDATLAAVIRSDSTPFAGEVAIQRTEPFDPEQFKPKGPKGRRAAKAR